VDVDFDIEEGLPGQFGGGIGYSGSQGFLLNGNFVHTNFLGTGNRIAADVSTGQYRTIYSISHTDPYTTNDEGSRTVSLAYRDITQYTSGASDFSTETFTASVEYGYPITEYQRLIFGFSWQESNLLADSFTLYLKTHNFHWNVTGPQFNSLHLMFMGQYTEQWNALDLIAERIRALGHPAPGTYKEFVRLATNRSDTIDVLQDLVDRSLIQREDSAQGIRYTVLESIRHYIPEDTPPKRVSELRASHAELVHDLV